LPGYVAALGRVKVVRTLVFISNHDVFTLTVKEELVEYVYCLSNHGVFTLPPNVPVDETSIVPVNVLFPPNVCVVALTTPIVELPANAIDITGVVVPVATLKPFAGLPALTLVTVPLPPVADNVPLVKDNPVPTVTVANLSVEDNPANLVAV
jgi:hypothetical protein